MLPESVASLPKAELHLHLEGSVQPGTACALAARHGVRFTEEEVRRRYAYRNFSEFLEAFKWVTSFLRDPQDYALITRDLGEQLRGDSGRRRAVRQSWVAHELDFRCGSSVRSRSGAARGGSSKAVRIEI